MRVGLAVLFLALALGGCVYAPPTNVSLQRYEVEGRTFAELERSWSTRGPVTQYHTSGAFAAVSPSFSANFVPQQFSAECRYDPRGRVFLNVELTLPEWKGRENAAQEVRDKWDAFMAYALKHEGEHIAISRRFARLLESRFRSGVADDCEELARRTERDALKLIEKHHFVQNVFDATDPPRFRRFVARYYPELAEDL